MPANSANHLSPRSHTLRGYFYIAAAGLCWAVSAILVKLVFSGRVLPGIHIAPLDPVILSQARTTISLLLLAPVLALARGRRSLALPLPDAARGLLLGVLGLAGSNFFYYFAIEKTTVTIAIIVQYTAPVWVLLYMVARGKEKATLLRVSAVMAALVGVGLTIGIFNQSALRLAWLGIFASMMAAFSFSFYNVYGHTLLASHDRWRVMTYALLGSALFWMVVNNPWKIAAAHYSGAQWLFLLIFALLSMLAPFVFYFTGLQYLDPTRAIVTSCLEPVFTVLLAVLFVGETFGPLQALGMVMVLLATIVVQSSEKEELPPELPAVN